MAKVRDYLRTREAITIACDAVLLRASPRLSYEIGEERFALNSALRDMVWKYSEETPLGRGKQGCAFWSEKALNRRNGDGRLILEHVFPREEVFKELLRATSREQIKQTLDRLQTCVLMDHEHKLLETPGFTPNHDKPGGWWQRYRLETGAIVVRKGPKWSTNNAAAFPILNKTWEIIFSLTPPHLRKL